MLRQIMILTALSLRWRWRAPPRRSRARRRRRRRSRSKQLVDRAAALVDRNGKAAFAEFRKKDSRMVVHGSTYLFAYDMKGNVLLNPAFPEREGTNVTGRGTLGQALASGDHRDCPE